MTDKKGWGSTVLGWFVVREDGTQEEPEPQELPPGGVVFEDDRPKAQGAPEPPAFVKEPPAAPGGKVDFDAVYEAAVQEIQVLEGYMRAGGADTAKVFEESQKRIAEYEEEIRRIKTVMEQRLEEQKGVVKSCNEKKLEVQHVLEFFGQEVVAKVVRDSPKLVEPGGAG